METKYLKFPLVDVDQYGGKIHFQVIKEIPPTLTLFPSKTGHPGLRDDQPQDLSSDIIESDNLSTTTATSFELGGRATLYLPSGIQFADGISYEEFELGRIGAGMEKAIKSGLGLTGSAAAFGQGALSTITDFFNEAKSPESIRLAATRITKGGSNIQGAVTSALQTTTNPNKRILFKEVNLRSFSFSFKLIPMSKEEAETIKEIIHFFRSEMYPEDSVVLDGIPIGYQFPNKFEITFMHNDTNIAHKILPSYLDTMDTTYNSTGAGFFDDGNFSEVDISMTFKEHRALSKEDVVSGGY